MTPKAMAADSIERKVNNTVVRLQHGDLTALPVDAFVFYAREDLALGAGYGSAIQSRGGAAIKKELDKISSVKMGEAVVTTAGGLNSQYIIHACGPKFQEPDLEKKLRACILSALRAAEEKKLKTVALPPMGAGFYGVPLNLCSTVMLDIITSFLRGETSLQEVIICVIDRRDFDAFKDKVERL